MKRKWKIAAIAVCVCFLVTVAYAALGGAGTQGDPLVTLSYLTNVFKPNVENVVRQTVASQQAQNKSELDAAIQNWDYKVQQAISEAGVSGGGGAAFKEVTLEGEQTLVLTEGCEVLLRTGKATWVAEGQQMMDTTAGSALVSGKALSANHLYMSLGAGSIAAPGSQTSSQPTGTVTAGPLNVRSGPGSGYNKVGTVNEGDVVTILASSNGWYQVTVGNLSGYVSGSYVTLNSSGTTQTTPGSATLLVRGIYQVK